MFKVKLKKMSLIMKINRIAYTSCEASDVSQDLVLELEHDVPSGRDDSLVLSDFFACTATSQAVRHRLRAFAGKVIIAVTLNCTTS